MTIAEKPEQAFTGQPDSYVPAHTMERLLREPHKGSLPSSLDGTHAPRKPWAERPHPLNG